MKTVNAIVSGFLGLVMSTGLYAQHPGDACEEFDLNSVTYIEEEQEVDLGFDTKDYLPEDFDPYQLYVDLNAIEYVEEGEVVLNVETNLPHDFNPYGIPADFMAVSYIDPTDEVVLNIETEKFLPEGFNPYSTSKESETISL